MSKLIINIILMVGLGGLVFVDKVEMIENFWDVNWTTDDGLISLHFLIFLS
jgi:hypothetical protein